MPKSIDILYEDDTCLILNKPAGLAVQGGAGVLNSLDSLLSRIYSPRPLLIHRLDKDTSGVILVAKDKNAAARFSRIMGGGAAVEKQYLAVCAGTPENRSGIIRMDIDVQGKRKYSTTRYEVLSTAPVPLPAAEIRPDIHADFRGKPSVFSLLRLEPGTGRMHQLRRHMALTNTPILGDDKYGDFSLNKTLGKTMKLKRLLLHAFRLRIPEGFGVPALDVCAPLPPHFTAFLKQINCPVPVLRG
jgi:23S rRNA pseudouridine955/2504/2580 synthase